MNGSAVLISLGKGDGTFIAEPVSPAVGAYPSNVAAGDFNKDGNADLAVTSGSGPGFITILLGHGDGTFTAATANPPVGNSPLGLAVGDFNGDGILDLATSNAHDYSVNDVTILLGNGDGSFKPGLANSAGGYGPGSLTIADLNADGVADLAVGKTQSGAIAILTGNGDGTFAAVMNFATATSQNSGNIAAADFNGDGIPDLADAEC